MLNLLRRLHLNGPAKRVFHATWANPVWRRLVTSDYRSGLVAIGESYYNLFPARWVTVDWNDSDFSTYFDADTPLPLPDASARILFSAHMIEHLADRALEHFLAECSRVVRPGGHIRLEAPDAEYLVDAYRRRDEACLAYFRDARRRDLVGRLGLDERYLEDHLTVLGEISNYIDHERQSGHVPAYATQQEFDARLEGGLESLNAWAQELKTPEQRASGGHNNAIYFDKLERLLTLHGFGDVHRVSHTTSTIPGLALDRPLRRYYDSIPSKPYRAFYSVFVEATRSR